jgi:hypothetical protein
MSWRGHAPYARFIYVLGGFVPTPSGATTRVVTRYDIDANEWTKVRSMPVGVNHPAVAAYKGSLYVHRGYTGVVTRPIDRLFRYTHPPPIPGWSSRIPAGRALRMPWSRSAASSTRRAAPTGSAPSAFSSSTTRPATVGAPAPQCASRASTSGLLRWTASCT